MKIDVFFSGKLFLLKKNLLGFLHGQFFWVKRKLFIFCTPVTIPIWYYVNKLDRSFEELLTVYYRLWLLY